MLPGACHVFSIEIVSNRFASAYSINLRVPVGQFASAIKKSEHGEYGRVFVSP